MKEQYTRTAMVMGEKALDKLRASHVLVFGAGGVGGNAIEALARCGIGTIGVVDNDTVAVSNLNRQAVATQKTLGMLKTDAAEIRIRDIDPDITVHKYPMFYLPETKGQIDFANYDYIIDAIDTVTAKLDIIETARDLNIPVISAMGCGNRIDPRKLTVTDIYKTEGDPLAKIMRRELKKRSIKKLKVVYSTEKPVKPLFEEENSRRHIPGSTAFVPSSAGILIASVVCRELSGYDPENRE